MTCKMVTLSMTLNYL